MEIRDFLSLFNENNSIKDESTNSITITVSTIEESGTFHIKSPVKIKSNCNTTIKCSRIYITSEKVSFEGIQFQCALKLENANNFCLLNCELHDPDSEYAGIEIWNCNDISIEKVLIYDLNQPAIHIKSKSILTVNNITIRDIKTTMFVCFDHSTVKVTNSTFDKSTANGILTDDQTSIEILNCTFSDFSNPAVFIENSKCVVKDCKFSKVEQNCLSITRTCENFLIENNEFTEIEATAISISNESYGSVIGNKIFKIGGNGILCSMNSKAEIKNNKIEDLTYPSISISSLSTGELSGNEIKRVKYSGIAVRRAKEVTIEKCSIESIGESGISISETEKCTIKNNEIKECEVAGVESYNKSNAYIMNNIITNVEKYAFLAYTSGIIHAEKNIIKNVKNSMTKLVQKGGGIFIDNEIENVNNQCDCQTSASYFFNCNDSSKKSSSVLFDDSFTEDKNMKCMKCNKNDRNCFLIDCGHKVFCKECADLACKNKENCFENTIDCIILPCGHMCVCSQCLEHWFKNNQTCPVCRNDHSFYKNI